MCADTSGVLDAMNDSRYVSDLTGNMLETRRQDDNFPVTFEVISVPTPHTIPLRSTVADMVWSPHPCTDYRPCVFYPDLLSEVLYRKPVGQKDMLCMIARCVEHGEEEYFAEESLHTLLQKVQPTSELRLLSWKYPIDHKLYGMACARGVRDAHYDSMLNLCSIPYQNSNLVQRKQQGERIGYRDVYHLLNYGDTSDRQYLITYWDIWGCEATIQAARDYLNVECDTALIRAHLEL